MVLKFIKLCIFNVNYVFFFLSIKIKGTETKGAAIIWSYAILSCTVSVGNAGIP
jgi:hypothetical protein